MVFFVWEMSPTWEKIIAKNVWKDVFLFKKVLLFKDVRKFEKIYITHKETATMESIFVKNTIQSL